jgi:hypothetical protein
MATDIEQEKVPYQSEALAKGARADPNDVGNARFHMDKATGQYIWGWPTYQNGRQVGVRAAAPDSYTDPNQPNPMNDPDKNFLRRQVNDTGNAVSGTPSADGGGGGGGGGIPGWAKIAAAALPAAASLATNPPGSNGSMSPELQQLLAQALKRMSSQDGLFNAVNAQAMAGLPTIYQR